MSAIFCYSIALVSAVLIVAIIVWDTFRRVRVINIISDYTIGKIETEEQSFMCEANRNIIRAHSQKLVDDNFDKWNKIANQIIKMGEA